MLKIILGVSITLNVLSAIIFFIIYKFSLKKVIKQLKKYSLDNFINENFDINDIEVDEFLISD